MTARNNVLKNIRHLTSQAPTYVRPRPPVSTDLKDPLTNKYYEVPSWWIIGQNKESGIPVASGTTGELWYLEKIVANVAYWVQITPGGTGPLTSADVDFNTAPGTDPVLPTAAGVMQIYGNTVTNATNTNAPVATHSRAVNQFHVDVQLAAAVAATPADPYDAGLCSFDDSHFSVDGNGFVQLKGGGLAIDTITGDDATAVSPDANGNINLTGEAVANGTNAKPVYFDGDAGTNTENCEVQVAAAVAPTPADKNDSGLSSYDNSQFTVDSNGFVQLLGGPGAEAINLGFNLTSGEFQITQADGSALSDTSPGSVRVQTRGAFAQNQVIKLTKPYKFDDDSHATTHDLVGWAPGLSGATGTTWTSNRPFFVYVIQNDTASLDPAVGISLIPDYSVVPASGLLNVSGTISSSAQGSMFLLSISDGMGGWTAPTVGDYDGNPCVCIGSFKMTYTDTSSVDWTATAFDGTDGVGQFQEGVQFTLPAGQRGAAASKYFQDNGGTAPGFSSNSATYYITRNGYCFFRWTFVNATVAGAGAVTLRLTDPYDAQSRSSGSVWHDENTAVTVYTYVAGVSPSNPYITFLKSGTAGSVLNTAIKAGATGDNFNGSAYYKINR